MPIRDNFRNMEENRLKLTMAPKTNKNKKNNASDEFNHKEKIIFNQGQLCPKCGQITNFDSSEILELTINSIKVNFEYTCKNCGEKKNSIDIKYQILLVNKNSQPLNRVSILYFINSVLSTEVCNNLICP